MRARYDLTTVCLPQQLALVDRVAQIGHDQIGPGQIGHGQIAYGQIAHGQIGVKSMGSPDCNRRVRLDRLAINH